MNRLTIRTPQGAALKMGDTYPSEDAAREALMSKFRIAVERLAAYEDTGLSPEEITDFLNIWNMYGGEVGITGAMQELKDRRQAANYTSPISIEDLQQMPVGIIDPGLMRILNIKIAEQKVIQAQLEREAELEKQGAFTEEYFRDKELDVQKEAVKSINSSVKTIVTDGTGSGYGALAGLKEILGAIE